MDKALKDHVNTSTKPNACIMPVEEATDEEREAFRAKVAEDLGHDDFVVLAQAEAAARMRRQYQERALARERCRHGEVLMKCPICRRDA